MGSKSSSALGRSVGTPSKRFPVIVVIVNIVIVIVVIVIVSTPSKRFHVIKNSLEKVPSHPPTTPHLGKGPATKSDDFLEKMQTAFDPLPPFLENYINSFILDMVAYMQIDMRAR